MKKTFKTALLTLGVSALLVACKGKGSAAADSLKADTSVKTTVVDSVKKDTSSLPDSLKKDTTLRIKKTETKTKMTETRKN